MNVTTQNTSYTKSFIIFKYRTFTRDVAFFKKVICCLQLDVTFTGSSSSMAYSWNKKTVPNFHQRNKSIQQLLKMRLFCWSRVLDLRLICSNFLQAQKPDQISFLDITHPQKIFCFESVQLFMYNNICIIYSMGNIQII